MVTYGFLYNTPKNPKNVCRDVLYKLLVYPNNNDVFFFFFKYGFLILYYYNNPNNQEHKWETYKNNPNNSYVYILYYYKNPIAVERNTSGVSG